MWTFHILWMYFKMSNPDVMICQKDWKISLILYGSIYTIHIVCTVETNIVVKAR